MFSGRRITESGIVAVIRNLSTPILRNVLNTTYKGDEPYTLAMHNRYMETARCELESRMMRDANVTA